MKASEDSKKFSEKSAKKKSMMSSANESEKAALLYTYNVVPNFFKGMDTAIQDEMDSRPSNMRKSTHYNWVSFFPIAFGLQFKKIVNIFYLITGILNFFPAYRVNNPFAVIGPTIIIMLIGVTKEFISELQRYRDDKKVNATPVERLALPGDSVYQNSNESIATT